MATHSSTLAWRIPWTEEPGRLQSMGSQRVGHDWVTSLHFTLSLLGILWKFVFSWVYLSLSPLLFTSLLSSAIWEPPQTTTLLSWISFSLGWFWSLTPIQCYESLSIDVQALCLSDLIPWIYLTLPLCNLKGFDLGHTWIVQWFPYFLQICNKELRIWPTVSAPGLVFADCIELLHLQLQRI